MCILLEIYIYIYIYQNTPLKVLFTVTIAIYLALHCHLDKILILLTRSTKSFCLLCTHNIIHPLLLLLRTKYYPEHSVLKRIQCMLHPQPQLPPKKGQNVCIALFIIYIVTEHMEIPTKFKPNDINQPSNLILQFFVKKF